MHRNLVAQQMTEKQSWTLRKRWPRLHCKLPRSRKVNAPLGSFLHAFGTVLHCRLTGTLQPEHSGSHALQAQETILSRM